MSHKKVTLCILATMGQILKNNNSFIFAVSDELQTSWIEICHLTSIVLPNYKVNAKIKKGCPVYGSQCSVVYWMLKNSDKQSLIATGVGDGAKGGMCRPKLGKNIFGQFSCKIWEFD